VSAEMDDGCEQVELHDDDECDVCGEAMIAHDGVAGVAG
jgi:hypothetical protein